MGLLSDASLFLSIVASIFSKTDFCLSKTAYIESNGAYRWVMAIYGAEVAKNKKAAKWWDTWRLHDARLKREVIEF